jgi:multisubunit Na+/H+ antiporter MnhG subunit
MIVRAAYLTKVPHWKRTVADAMKERYSAEPNRIAERSV